MLSLSGRRRRNAEKTPRESNVATRVTGDDVSPRSAVFAEDYVSQDDELGYAVLASDGGCLHDGGSTCGPW